MKVFHRLTLVVSVIILSACVSSPPAYDYTQFRNSDPVSILVLPPINNTNEVIATHGVLANLTYPIAESGFYVFPVALVEQTFSNNGLTVPNDIHAAPITKLREIFGADAALYTRVEEYGTSYVVISSQTVVTIHSKLLDLRTGEVLWQRTATASSAESQGNSGGGLAGMLIQAALTQIIETVADAGFDIAKVSANRLLNSSGHNGLLHGPRSPQYGQPATSEKVK